MAFVIFEQCSGRDLLRRLIRNLPRRTVLELEENLQVPAIVPQNLHYLGNVILHTWSLVRCAVRNAGGMKVLTLLSLSSLGSTRSKAFAPLAVCRRDLSRFGGFDFYEVSDIS